MDALNLGFVRVDETGFTLRAAGSASVVCEVVSSGMDGLGVMLTAGNEKFYLWVDPNGNCELTKKQ